MPKLKIKLVRSSRKTLCLQVKEGMVIARSPKQLEEAKIRDFIAKKQGWLMSKVEQWQNAQKNAQKLETNQILLFGQVLEYPYHLDEKKKQQIYKTELLSYIYSQIEVLCDAVGVKFYGFCDLGQYSNQQSQYYHYLAQKTWLKNNQNKQSSTKLPHLLKTSVKSKTKYQLDTPTNNWLENQTHSQTWIPIKPALENLKESTISLNWHKPESNNQKLNTTKVKLQINPEKDLSNHLNKLWFSSLTNSYNQPKLEWQPSFWQIKIRNDRSRWGSCNNQGVITFSLKLARKPKMVIDYVIVHELCHLLELNHSPKFWKEVDRSCQKLNLDWKNAKKMLVG